MLVVLLLLVHPQFLQAGLHLLHLLLVGLCCTSRP
jgi:hypothetical protein